jgi:uncharacterized membrane protein
LDKQTKRKADILFSLVLLAFIAVIMLSSVGLNPDTRRLPLLIACFTLFFIVLSDASILRDYTRAKVSPSPEDAKKSKPIPVKKIALSVALMCVVLISWLLAGFVIGGAISTIIYVYCLGEKRPAVVVLVPLCVTLALYAMFSKFLMAPLPRGILIRMLG